MHEVHPFRRRRADDTFGYEFGFTQFWAGFSWSKEILYRWGIEADKEEGKKENLTENRSKEIWLCVFSFLNLRNLRRARLVCKTWCGIAESFLHLRFEYHGCDQNAVQFLQLAPIRLPLEISSHWYSLEPHKDQLDANLDQLKQLESISLSLARGLCRSCDEFPSVDLDNLESTPFWRICKLIEETKICLQSLNLAQHTRDSRSAKFLPRLAENFPIQYLSLEELTLNAIPENGDIGAFYKFIQTCQRLKRLRIGMTSLQFPTQFLEASPCCPVGMFAESGRAALLLWPIKAGQRSLSATD